MYAPGLRLRLFAATLCALLLGAGAARPEESSAQARPINSQRLQVTLEKLSEFGRNPEGGVTRLGFSQTDLDARTYVMSLMKDAGLEIRVDPAGNIFGRRSGSEQLPTLLFGSHIDRYPTAAISMDRWVAWALSKSSDRSMTGISPRATRSRSSGIVGLKRCKCVAAGFANHAGTTPMNRRKDALAAAAKNLLALRDVVRAEPGTQVGTVGYLKAEPGAPNVIPGRVEFSVELRDLHAGKIERMWQHIQQKFAEVDKEIEGVETRCEVINDIAAAPSDLSIQSVIREAAQLAGLSTADMPSGAVHEISRIAPMGMIFVRRHKSCTAGIHFMGGLCQRGGSPLPLGSAARPAAAA